MALFLGEQEYDTEQMKANLLKVATPDLLSGLPRDTINLLLHHNYAPSAQEENKPYF